MILKTLVAQLISRPATNRFPVKYMPKSVTRFLAQVQEGKAKIHPPVPVPPKFRGKSPTTGRSVLVASFVSGCVRRR